MFTPSRMVSHHFDLLQNIHKALCCKHLQYLREKLEEYIDPDTVVAKGPLQVRSEECFAVRSGLYPELDVARQIHAQTLESINSLVTENQGTWGLKNLKLKFSPARGFYFQTSVQSVIPMEAIEVIQLKKTSTFSTKELSSLSRRYMESVEDVYRLSYQAVRDLRGIIVQNLEPFLALSQGIALLDVLMGFAHLVTISHHRFVKPTMLEAGNMVVRGAREIVTEELLQNTHQVSYVSNDITLAQDIPVNLVFGINGSGKTTLMRSVGLLHVLAQIGCFVPALTAEIPLRDRILTRMGADDDLRANASTFFLEMKETAHILDVVTPQSLILIDELGRG